MFMLVFISQSAHRARKCFSYKPSVLKNTGFAFLHYPFNILAPAY